jgi:hypothetical protein
MTPTPTPTPTTKNPAPRPTKPKPETPNHVTTTRSPANRPESGRSGFGRDPTILVKDGPNLRQTTRFRPGNDQISSSRELVVRGWMTPLSLDDVRSSEPEQAEKIQIGRSARSIDKKLSGFLAFRSPVGLFLFRLKEWRTWVV